MYYSPTCYPRTVCSSMFQIRSGQSYKRQFHVQYLIGYLTYIPPHPFFILALLEISKKNTKTSMRNHQSPWKNHQTIHDKSPSPKSMEKSPQTYGETTALSFPNLHWHYHQSVGTKASASLLLHRWSQSPAWLEKQVARWTGKLISSLECHRMPMIKLSTSVYNIHTVYVYIYIYVCHIWGDVPLPHMFFLEGDIMCKSPFMFHLAGTRFLSLTSGVRILGKTNQSGCHKVLFANP